jgi:hypothetical protein
MLRLNHIDLIPRRQEDLHGNRPDYLVYAGAQLVGRIYQTHLSGLGASWFWGVNGLTVDMTVGATMHGHAADLQDAKAKLRTAFDRWHQWAMAMPADDLKHPRLAAELKRMTEPASKGPPAGVSRRTDPISRPSRR